jgi:hypothetical protein
MGFLDKAKAATTAAMQQGQAKVEAIQQSRTEAELYRNLGEASYRAQRQGADQAAVDAAFAALDAHFAAVQAAAASAASAGSTASASAGSDAAAASAAPMAPPPPTGVQPAQPTGNFTLDDL